jgi:transposase
LQHLAADKVNGVAEAIETAGATIAAYSLDLNPIEQAFAKLTSALHEAAARTANAVACGSDQRRRAASSSGVNGM